MRAKHGFVAFALAALALGGMILARSVADSPLSLKLLQLAVVGLAFVGIREWVIWSERDAARVWCQIKPQSTLSGGRLGNYARANAVVPPAVEGARSPKFQAAFPKGRAAFDSGGQLGFDFGNRSKAASAQDA